MQGVEGEDGPCVPRSDTATSWRVRLLSLPLPLHACPTSVILCLEKESMLGMSTWDMEQREAMSFTSAVVNFFDDVLFNKLCSMLSLICAHIFLVLTHAHEAYDDPKLKWTVDRLKRKKCCFCIGGFGSGAFHWLWHEALLSGLGMRRLLPSHYAWPSRSHCLRASSSSGISSSHHQHPNHPFCLPDGPFA